MVQKEIPAEYQEEAEERRLELIEHVSNADEALGELFLEETEPTVQQIKVRWRRQQGSRGVPTS